MRDVTTWVTMPMFRSLTDKRLFKDHFESNQLLKAKLYIQRN
jgi:hypothetical protein